MKAMININFRWNIISRLLILAMTAVGLASCVSHPTKSHKKQPFTFVQICDPQLGMGGYEHDLKTFKQAVDQVNALKPDLVVICGDLVGRLNKKSVDDFNRIRAGFTMPSYCVPGNHDVFHGPQDKRHGISHAQSLANYRKAIGKDYYSFEHKGYMFVCANTQLWKFAVTGESDKQDQWFKTTLAAASKRGLPVFVVMHHPLYTGKPDEKDGYYNLPIAKRKELLGLFETHGVVAVLTGHAHKVIINEHKGIQLVTGQATSRTHGSPLGFRLWHIKEPRPLVHESIKLKDIK